MTNDMGQKGTRFYTYFVDQWIGENAVFSKWRVLDTPPAYCGTNNSLEATNRSFKRIYLENMRQPITTLFESFEARLRRDSRDALNFKDKILVSNDSKRIACKYFRGNHYFNIHNLLR